MSDELFELRNYFYLGNLAAATQEGSTVSVDDEKSQIERDVILRRIDLSKGNSEAVISSVSASSAPALQLTKVLAQLLIDPSQSEASASKVKQLSTDETTAASPCCLLMCAIIYTHLGDFDNALRTANRARSLETLSLMIQVLLKIDRCDVAENELTAMQAIDEDATLTQLSASWIHLYKGGDNVQEAIYIYQDLLERHGATEQVLNGMAVCHLAMGKPDESERVLTEALTKNPNCVISLTNVICSSKYKNKSAELVSRYFAQLQKVSPTNKWLLDYRSKEDEFDALAQQFAVA